ncbi:MAG TPA: RDD family protein [Verrucomicrobiae bacterium]|nr:RDD family protein [Verrucomicrobiae bacterium]
MGQREKCQECGAAAELIEIGQRWVCASCKPAALQLLKEGAKTKTRVTFSRRAVACFLDGLVLLVVNTFAFIVLWKKAGVNTPGKAFIAPFCIQIGTGFVYEVLLVWLLGETVGKMLCGLHVVGPKGGRLTLWQSVVRYLAKLLSSVSLGYLGAVGGQLPLHDRLCKTRVRFEPAFGVEEVKGTAIHASVLLIALPGLMLSLPLPPLSGFGVVGVFIGVWVAGHMHIM